MNMSKMMFELVESELDPFLEKLFEGGAFGHLAHPFEDLDLTFGQLKSMVQNILSGKTETFEKIDGQQISFSWKGGHLVGARNKSHIREFGKNSLTANAMRDFIGRSGNVPKQVVDAFYMAMVDLERALRKLPEATLKNTFQEGRRFMNTEVVAEETTNVIPYYKDYLVFHGLIEYDVNGNPIRQIKGSGKQLEDAVNSVGQSNQTKYQIKGPNKIVLKNFSELPRERNEFIGELKKLQGNMPDDATIADQQEQWWKTFTSKAAKEMGYKIPNTVLDMLARRWGRLEKSVNTIPKIVSQIDNPRFKNWVITYDKNEHEKQYEENMFQYELYFLRLGAEVLANASGYLSASPINTVSNLAKGIQNDALKIKQSKDLNDIKKLREELERLEKVGKNKMVGSEGVVFSMNGKLYKLTGVFAPVNRILAILRYKKPSKPLEQPVKEGESVLNLLDAPNNPIERPLKTVNESVEEPTKVLQEKVDVGVYDKDYAEVHGKFRKEFLNNVEGTANWKLVPADLLRNTWATFAKYGRADEEKVLKIWSIIKETSLKLIIAGIALDMKDPEFFLASTMKDNRARKLRDKFIQYVDYTFTYRYEDFALLLKSVYSADTPEELLYGIDRILNFVHDRGDMAYYLVQGGKSTLSDIFQYRSKGIHLIGKLFEDVIREGGNVVYTNSTLENKYLDATIKNALKIWGFGKLKYEVVGSKHKPVMNDIDVAVDSDEIGKIVGAKPDDKASYWSKIESFLKYHEPDVPEPSFKTNKGLDQIHISAPIIGDEGKFIQIDLMLGDVEWMKDHLSGSVNSQYKSVYRNILLADILAHSHEPTKDPNVIRKYQINSKRGFQMVNLINKAGKIEKSVPHIVYNNMNDVAAFLFGPGTTFNDINTFEKLFKLLDSSSFRYKNKKSDILDTFNKDLIRLKLPPIKE